MPPRSPSYNDALETSSLLHTKEATNDPNDEETVSTIDTTFSSQPANTELSIISEIQKQGDIIILVLYGMVLSNIPWLISLRFVGDIGPKELASAGLATSVCNVTGLSLSVGLSSALSTLAGQSKGQMMERLKEQQHLQQQQQQQDFEMSTPIIGNKHQKQQTQPLIPLVYLYRGLFIQLVIIMPVIVWWLNGIEDFLIYTGQDETISTMTQSYLQILAPAFLIYSINWTFTAWLQAIGMPDVPSVAALIGLLLHVPFNYFFIYFLDWGYLGAAVATVMFYLVQCVYVLSYLFAYNQQRLLESIVAKAIGRSTLSFWQEARIGMLNMAGIIEYVKLALPGIIVVSEWWASETAIFLSGHLHPSPDAALAGISIYQSINGFCFMFPLSIGIAGSTRVANLLGGDKPKSAEFSAKVCAGLAALISALIGCILYVIPHSFFPSLFAPNEVDVISESSRLIPLLSIYVFADGIQTALTGIIRGCGRQCISMPIVVFAYWVIALPMGYYLSFIRHDGEMYCDDDDDGYFCGVVGLVAGLTAGTWVHASLFALVIALTTNWDVEATKAKERLSSN